MVSKNITRRQRLSQTFYYMTSCVLVSMSSTLILSSVSPASQPWNCNSFQAVEAFTSPPHNHRHPFGQSSFATTTAGARTHLFSSPTTEDTSETNPEELDGDHSPTDCPTVVRAPLKFIGPYPCLALRFPNLATESQRSRNITGISLDFVMDTAANINTVQSQVAQELLLSKQEDSPALPGVSSSGPMDGGDTYVLGDSQLEQAAIMVLDNLREQTEEERKQQQKEPFEFMQNLTAAALPVVNPGSAGLLGLAFFYCFEGGVEFRWGSTQQQPQLVDGMIVPTDFRDDSSPSLTFYGENDSSNSDSLLQRALSDLVRVPIETIPVTQLPSLKIKVNGVEVMALLDTGSPVTVLNQGAAQAAGIQTTQDTAKAAAAQTNSAGGWKNPFSSVVDKFKEAQATAEAAAKGEILMIGGSDGKPVTLYRSASDHHPSISVATGLGGDDLSFGSGLPVYVGDIPGLAALNGIGVDSPPAVVLGLDVLRKRPRMLFRPRENEVYF